MLGSLNNVRALIRMPSLLCLALRAQCAVKYGIDRRLAQQTRLLKERNQALLRAVGSGRNNNLSSSTASTSGANEYVPTFRLAHIVAVLMTPSAQAVHQNTYLPSFLKYPHLGMKSLPCTELKAKTPSDYYQ